VPEGAPLIVGIDETLERRWGRKIAAKGVYRDPVRSTHETFVKSSGLRWVCVMLLVEVPWAARVWALPFISALAPSVRALCRPAGQTAQEDNRVGLAAAPGAKAVVPTAGDSGRSRPRLRLSEAARPLPQALRPDHLRQPFALGCCPLRAGPATTPPSEIGRPRLKGERLPNLSAVSEDPNTVWKPTKIANWYGSEERVVEVASETAVWYSTGLFAVPIRWVLVRDPQAEFKTQALLCTDLDADPQKIVCWFVMRWQLEVTFQEMRRHLGFETQRQWSDMAIRRTTPALLGLFSVIALFAHQRMGQASGAFRRQAAWYRKRHPTFADALALVRKELWAQEQTFCGSPAQTDTVKVPRIFMERLTEAVCYAA
jgi:hypothetical protein